MPCLRAHLATPHSRSLFQVQDLLNPQKDHSMRVREHQILGPYVEGCVLRLASMGVLLVAFTRVGPR